MSQKFLFLLLPVEKSDFLDLRLADFAYAYKTKHFSVEMFKYLNKQRRLRLTRQELVSTESARA